LGIRNCHDTQLVLVDTPGFLRMDRHAGHTNEKGSVDRSVVVAATDELQLVDFTVLVVDAARTWTPSIQATVRSLLTHALQQQQQQQSNTTTETESTIEQEDRQRLAIVLNKVDLVHPKSKLIDLAVQLSTMAEELVDELILNNTRHKETTNETAGSDLDGTTAVAAQQQQEEQEQDELHRLLRLDQLRPTFFYISALKGQGLPDLLE
jgi:GTPase Era involved in 16S rRNA processing